MGSTTARRSYKIKVDDVPFSQAEKRRFEIECPLYEYIPTYMAKVQRIIAIGDVHGDVNLARRCFKLAELIDDYDHWIAIPLNTIVVQVGDQIDSCRPTSTTRCDVYVPDDKTDDIGVLQFFDHMHQIAKVYGGSVYSLLGNHEMMNAQGNFDYVSYKNLVNFKYNQYSGLEGRQHIFAPGGEMARHLACTRLSVLVIGSTIFAHAGILPQMITKLDQLNLSNEDRLVYLNDIVRRWLLNTLDRSQKLDAEIFINSTVNSPFWNRILGSIPKNTSLNSEICDSNVRSVLAFFKLDNMVIGHTPQLNTSINGACSINGINHLYKIDGGFSSAFDRLVSKRPIQILEIRNDSEFRIITDQI